MPTRRSKAGLPPDERVAAEGTTFSVAGVGVGVGRETSDPVVLCDGWFGSASLFRALFDARNHWVAVAYNQALWALMIGK